MKGTKAMKNSLPVETIKSLIRSAVSGRERSYSIYSGFSVGAAVLTDDGRIFSGCNVENASFPAGSCAETVAVNKAVSEGAKHITAIAIIGGKAALSPSTDSYTFPCGICRQVISEFKSPDGTIVIVARNEDDYKIFSIDELLPGAFSGDSL